MTLDYVAEDGTSHAAMYSSVASQEVYAAARLRCTAPNDLQFRAIILRSDEGRLQGNAAQLRCAIIVSKGFCIKGFAVCKNIITILLKSAF